MAKILIAFYNGIEDSEQLGAMPLFYEALIKGLDEAGNDLLVFSHKIFGRDIKGIDEETKREIIGFKPDICFIFNNSFYDLSAVVECPIVIYEVDSPYYFSNREIIKNNPDRYLFFIIQTSSRKVLIEEFGVDNKHIFYTHSFSEVYARGGGEGSSNISFIGSRFLTGDMNFFQKFISYSPSQKEWDMLHNCMDEIRVNPQITPTELVYKFNITSELVAKSLNIPDILMTLSGEKRMKVLSAVVELGLDLYGPSDWMNQYYNNTDLNFAYINKSVYSVEHNQTILNNSKIGINVSHLQAASGFPWRVMDIMGSNACLVTDYHSDFIQLFPEVIKILPIYESPFESYDLCKKLIQDKPRRREIVLRCNEVINSKYRFKNLLPLLEEYSGIKMHIE